MHLTPNRNSPQRLQQSKNTGKKVENEGNRSSLVFDTTSEGLTVAVDLLEVGAWVPKTMLDQIRPLSGRFNSRHVVFALIRECENRFSVS